MYIYIHTGNNISGGEILHVQLAIQCLRPFNSSPSCTASFNNFQEKHSYVLKLPITAASFFESIPTDKATYMTRYITHTYKCVYIIVLLYTYIKHKFICIYINTNTNIYRWKSLEAEKTESQEIFQLTKKIDSAYLSHVRSTIIPALHIGAAIGLDSDTTVTGSCSFQTGTVPPTPHNLYPLNPLTLTIYPLSPQPLPS